MDKRILLNVCCGPCAFPIIEYLIKQDQQQPLVLYFFAPNISPPDEYQRRLTAAQKVAQHYNLPLIEGEYDHVRWLEYVKTNLLRSPENYAENSGRCLACFSYRIGEAGEYAAKHDFAEFAITLSVSAHKDTQFMNSYAEFIALREKVNYHSFPLEAKTAHHLGAELSRRLGIYRQKYCGCEFSLNTGS
jgi:predicted adenine nucleotide alpha hydrolase (AANH) superfamily ATPase